MQKLELNNISDLYRAILILLRADYVPERRMGSYNVPLLGLINIYGLVMLLNKSEYAISAALTDLESTQLVKFRRIKIEGGRLDSLFSELSITHKGLSHLELEGKSMAYTNINIINSSVGFVALHSTLSNIDTKVGNIKHGGHEDVATALSKLTEEVVASTRSDKKDILEQIELLTEQGEKDPSQRKPGIVKAVLTNLEKVLSSTADLAKIWGTWGPTITAFFN